MIIKVKIPLDSFIKESIDKLESTIEKLNTDLDTLINTTIETMFISELNLYQGGLGVSAKTGITLS